MLAPEFSRMQTMRDDITDLGSELTHVILKCLWCVPCRMHWVACVVALALIAAVEGTTYTDVVCIRMTGGDRPKVLITSKLLSRL